MTVDIMHTIYHPI